MRINVKTMDLDILDRAAIRDALKTQIKAESKRVERLENPRMKSEAEFTVARAIDLLTRFEDSITNR